MVQFQTEVSAIAADQHDDEGDGQEADARAPWSGTERRCRAMKADSMNTSPWAKLIMPMMPKTIV